MFDNISPLDYRYRDEEALRFLSEEGAIKYMAMLEGVLAETFADFGVCSRETAAEVKKAAVEVRAKEVYKEEKWKTRHLMMALVNVLCRNLSDDAKRIVHYCATSSDIANTADALRIKHAAENVLLPKLKQSLEKLIELALREKETLQIGRTHGQHAVPITFGFALSEYIDRLGSRILAIENAKNNLVGKMSGAVGAYNSFSLVIKDPEDFERRFLQKIRLKHANHSTQIAEPEYMLDLMHSIVSCFGVLANLSDDMRHLQRSEINEIAEGFENKQVGSSTMPHKRNPIIFENTKSLWKAFMPRIVTYYMDQISEHQRDLTNSASSRFLPELMMGLIVAVNNMNNAISRVVSDKESMKKNFEMNKDNIIAEPLYILLGKYGFVNAHEYVRCLVMSARGKNTKLMELVESDEILRPYCKCFTKDEITLLKNPERYTGKAVEKTEKACHYWKSRFIPHTLAVIGSQFGDEGKGKIVDILAKDYDYIVRYQGGNNAGHTVVAEGNTYKFHLIPSGVLYENKVNVLGNGTVIDLDVLVKEMENLNKLGLIFTKDNFIISDKAHLIMFYHKILDGINEKALGSKKVGTTKQGIGPCYADKAKRCGIRIKDLFYDNIFEEKLRKNINEMLRVMNYVYGYSVDDIKDIIGREYKEFYSEDEIIDTKKVKEHYLWLFEVIKPLIDDAAFVLNKAYEDGKKILFEGAQGTLLDIDHGTYPFVTSSNPTRGEVYTGSGFGKNIERITGIVKAYTTRVGEGPFATELNDSIGEQLRTKGHEFGTTTGRPRRCGWLDAVQLRYSCMINGYTDLAMTKLDVLAGLEKIKICVDYDVDGKRINHYSTDLNLLQKAKPIYEELDGWNEDIAQIKDFDNLPENAKKYLRRTEQLLGVRISMISVGAKREEIIIV